MNYKITNSNSQPTRSRDSNLLNSVAPSMRDLVEKISNIAPTKVPVLIQGGPGTGKIAAARLIHKLSNRSAGPFVHVHCTTMKKDSLSQIVFGPVESASKKGGCSITSQLMLAEKGTMLLSGIESIPQDFQEMLLHFLKNDAIPMGDNHEHINLNVRILATSDGSLNNAVRQGHFLKELFFRLNVFPIKLSSSQKCKEYIPKLIQMI